MGPNEQMENERAHKEAAFRVASMKKELKGLSKNQLIGLLMQQVTIALDQQNINKILIRQLEEIKGDKKNEESK